MRITIASILLVIATATAASTTPAATAERSRAYRTTHEQQIVDELTAFLSIPNVAADRTGIERNANAVVAMFARRGITARLLTLDSAPPLVVAEWQAPHATRTIGFYAHYDGQAVDPSQWSTPPFQPVIRPAGALQPESRIYARSASDDKAPIIAMLAAIDSLQAAKTLPAANVKFVFEGEEESGSPHLARYFDRYRNELGADAWMICDGPVHQSRRMQLYFGARGITEVEITTYGPLRPLHSGHYGNWAPNPIVTLTHLIDSMRGTDGRILIPGFYDDVAPLTAAETEALAEIPSFDAQLKQELAIGRTEGAPSSLNEQILLPAMNLRGIASGHVGEHATNTIQTEAQASIDFRLVPKETPESVRDRVERFLAGRGYFVVHQTPDAATRLAHADVVKLAWGSGYRASRTPMDSPIAKRVVDIVGEAMGQKPIRMPSLGGSVPMYLFENGGRTPVIGLPIANHDNNQHAPDENLRLQNLWDGVDVFAAIFANLQ